MTPALKTLSDTVFEYLEQRASEIGAKSPDRYLAALEAQSVSEGGLCRLGHLHGQVYNGGFYQWIANSYGKRDLAAILKIRDRISSDEVAPLFALLSKVTPHLDIDESCEPDCYDYWDEEDAEEAINDWEYEQEMSHAALASFDDLFYSDEYQAQFETVYKTLWEQVQAA